jgi:hypothetical protein
VIYSYTYMEPQNGGFGYGTVELPSGTAVFVEPDFAQEEGDKVFWATIDGSSYFLVWGCEAAEITA